MKEILSVLPELLRNFLPHSARDVAMFGNGVFLAVVLILLAALLILILKMLLFRRRRLSSVTLSLEHGNVGISAGAISDLVKSLESGFPELAVGKVILCKGKTGPVLFVKAVFHAGGRGIPEVGSSFQLRVQHELKESLGIDFIEKIDLSIVRSEKSSAV